MVIRQRGIGRLLRLNNRVYERARILDQTLTKRGQYSKVYTVSTPRINKKKPVVGEGSTLFVWAAARLGRLQSL
jgi:hypothetical protein